MPRKRIGPQTLLVSPRKELAAQLVEELKSGRESGQPLIFEKEFRTGKMGVTVIWDKWDRLPLEERSASILRAYELAEGMESRERVVLSTGLTVPEARAAGMLPYQILPALRKTDPLTPDQVREAMLKEGGSTLLDPRAIQLRFATEEDAEACRLRLIRRLPQSEPIWIINWDVTPTRYGGDED